MKYTVEKLGDDLVCELAEEANDWDLAHDYFTSDNPTCLDDEYPDCFSEWVQSEFLYYIDEGVFDKQIEEYIRSKE